VDMVMKGAALTPHFRMDVAADEAAMALTSN
jgi:hypothetical protein